MNELVIQFGYGGVDDERCVQRWCGKLKQYEIRCNPNYDSVYCQNERGIELTVGRWKSK